MKRCVFLRLKIPSFSKALLKTMIFPELAESALDVCKGEKGDVR